MMNKKKQIGMAILAVLMTASVTVWAANNDPLTISADTLSYDGNTGRADAKGNVVITQIHPDIHFGYIWRRNTFTVNLT